MKSILTISALIVLSAVTGCGGNGRPNVSVADTTAVEDTPRLSPEQQRLKDSLDSIAALPPDVLRNDVTTVEQADSFMRQSGYWTEYSQGVIDTIARQNIDYANRLLHNREPYFLVADKQRMMVVLYDRFGRPKRGYKMACSAQFGTKHAKRDNRTPEGFFSAEGIYDSTEWLFTDDDGNTSEKRGQFGPRFIRIKGAPMIGIHGTCAPWSRGHRASHGCMRIHNAHILELVTFATKGMPIIISPSDRDQRVNRQEGYTRITQLHLPKVEESPVDEDFPGLKDYLEREKLIQHRKDSIAAVERRREELAREREEVLRQAEATDEPADSTASDNENTDIFN
ncbi:MAG: L,D-transpeptidase [Muribaculaceae bacterium]|nr:L,D-transpeptidase [Muribaculaceae bacterium]